ncbi:hypothetical protein N7452_000120 [Penicillium brevicompactum]|uniref:Uncharacterized protein n=1 Tax=Penicillium brevicompactum TaxID=5074 RepID=A0A9W9UQM5_PENBR|nr:hypothetical protein N7452_000120 [Penicillium brevicompactum]
MHLKEDNDAALCHGHTQTRHGEKKRHGLSITAKQKECLSLGESNPGLPRLSTKEDEMAELLLGHLAG